MFKRMFLPFKLVEINGGTFTNAYGNIYEQSVIEWDFFQNKIDKPNKV